MVERTPQQGRKGVEQEIERSSLSNVIEVYGDILDSPIARKLLEAGVVIKLPGFIIASEATIEGIQRGEVLPPKEK